MELIITKFNNKTGDFQILIPVPYEVGNIRNCTAVDSKYELTENYNCFDLIKENQELKKQLGNYKNRYTNYLNCQLSEDIEPDPQDFYLAEIEGKANDYDELKTKYNNLLKENFKLKQHPQSNWNKLKDFIMTHKLNIDRMQTNYPSLDMFKGINIDDLLDKMQELEQGKDECMEGNNECNRNEYK